MLCAGIYGVVGWAAWQDAAAWVRTGDGFTDSVGTMGYNAAAVIWFVAAAMVALGVRLLAVPGPRDWTDASTIVGVLSWGGGFAPWVPFVAIDTRPRIGPDQLATASLWCWMAGGACLCVASLFLLVYLVPMTGARFADPGAGSQPRLRFTAIAWLPWLPSIVLFAAATLLLAAARR